ncbi:MAG: hypothetical protein PHZ04_00395 [Patescibacteria group bacterium]|nr:hypothetical protein [Patescibacteria group bacterium]MDD5555046.1 hypothetical protein [Patescibacteria group bacterium]
MDIDFLPDEEKKSKPSREQKEKKDSGEEVKWSSPEKEKKPLKPSETKKGIKDYLPDFFNANFLKKKKGKAGEIRANNLPDKNKLKESRRELLKLIGEEKRAEAYPPVSGKAEEAKVPLAKLKRPALHLEITRLFKPMVATFKKFTQKPKIESSREEKKQKPQPPLENKKEVNHRPSESGKEIVPEFIQAEVKKEMNGGETLETNLIKGEITVFFDWQKNAAFLIVSMILAAIVVGAIYGWLSWWGSQKEEENQYFVERFSELDKEIARVEGEAKKVLVFKKKLSLVNSLLDQHIYWTNFFKFLEENTLADVYYSGFAGDNKGKYSLTANAKNFSVIQAQVERFLSSEYISEASVSEAGISTAERKAGEANEIAFGLKLVIDPVIFTPAK